MASIHPRETAAGRRYDVRYRDPHNVPRKKTFARKVDAVAFANTIEADKLRGSYIDPKAGRMLFRQYAESWLAAQTFDRSTHEAVAVRLRLHVLPVLGGRQLAQVKPSTIQFPVLRVIVLSRSPPEPAITSASKPAVDQVFGQPFTPSALGCHSPPY